MTEFVDPAVAIEDNGASRQYLQGVADGLLSIERMRGRIVQLLEVHEPDAGWLERLQRALDDLLAVADAQPDLALYYLVNEKVNHTQHYSAVHSMCCALVVVLAAKWLEWPADEVRAIAGAALTMNLGMGPLQDLMARQSHPPSVAQREVIRNHAERSAQILQDAGVDDPLWLQAVRAHHTEHDAADPETLEPAVRAAELLRRVDVYAARLSSRKTRPALTAAMAARGALLGPSDQPDALGATLLRVLGLYPPGVYVELANGAIAVVIERGERAHTPLVVSLRRADGHVLLTPQALDTALRHFAVRRGIDAAQAQVRPGHLAILKARLQLGVPAAAAAQIPAADGETLLDDGAGDPPAAADDAPPQAEPAA